MTVNEILAELNKIPESLRDQKVKLEMHIGDNTWFDANYAIRGGITNTPYILANPE